MGLRKSHFLKLTALILMMILIITGCNEDELSESRYYNSGTYASEVEGHNGNMVVEVTFSDAKIMQIEVIEHSETIDIVEPVFENMPRAIINNQTLAIDAISGATVTSVALLSAIEDTVEQAGGDVQALRSKEIDDEVGEDEEITTDVVIVGAGASGTAAALAAAENGVDVVILEKTNAIGGAGLLGAEGLLAYESQAQKEALETATIDDGFRYLTNYTHFNANTKLTRAILEQSPDTIDWLLGYGMETLLIENTQGAHRDDPRTYHKYADKNVGFENMYNHLEAMGAVVYTNTPGETLIVDEAGHITGVIARKEDGGALTVNAQAVIIATGGFGGNMDMLKEYMSINPEDMFNMAFQASTGDGINMAFEAGADEFGIRTFEMHAAMINANLEGASLSSLVNIPLLWVNQEGVRFTDESNVYDHAYWGNSVYGAGGYYYFLFDNNTVSELKEEGSDLKNSFERTFLLAHPELVTGITPPLTDIEQDLEEGINKDVVWKADTIEELAEQIGADPHRLGETINQYNQAVQEKNDVEFLKPEEFLKYEVSEGPFYAVKAVSTSLGTLGGVRINERTQALSTDLKPINGLYVVGNDAGGLYGDTYPSLEGLSLSFAFNSGRIAGYESAYKILNK
ncbi:fumarate reductase flavoprotein subunit [Natranaerovirga hydrolytica]|uniref:Urocanate reductase n=1 Tax=Natranaerovirga hydrolytica TaxID=680378 RepID=A0A4R1MJT0_9FIRM|nr:FAD-dependent oxidoreductase [Natranaerovirga hydrolytica]TCK92767.1 fumarate reductase flavoprotein subunit [Natranaerovirga hydrolytica]